MTQSGMEPQSPRPLVNTLLNRPMAPSNYFDLIIKENREEAHEQKKNRYETLCADCVEKGWICHVIPIEAGCCGFIGHSVISFLSK